MASWSVRRKFLYGGTFIIIVIAIVVAVAFSFFYEKPTCFDAKQNGNESGIDCGGSCIKLCQITFLPAKIVWGGAKFEKVAESLYNVAALIENQNMNVAAVNVPYRISLFDAQGNYISEKKGTINIPPHRNTLVFDGAINVGKRIPAKATFEFISPPVWFKSHDTLDGLSIGDKKYTEGENSSSLEVFLKNNSLTPYTNIRVGAVLYDENNNAVGFSRTTIDQISPGGQELAPFTWPINRGGRVTSIEILPVVTSPRDP